jgi:hypothetical protein
MDSVYILGLFAQGVKHWCGMDKEEHLASLGTDAPIDAVLVANHKRYEAMCHESSRHPPGG